MLTGENSSEKHDAGRLGHALEEALDAVSVAVDEREEFQRTAVAAEIDSGNFELASDLLEDLKSWSPAEHPEATWDAVALLLQLADASHDDRHLLEAAHVAVGLIEAGGLSRLRAPHDAAEQVLRLRPWLMAIGADQADGDKQLMTLQAWAAGVPSVGESTPDWPALSA